MKKQAFTLVELIVVITILAILGTIGFISLQGYSRDSRDSVRITDMKNIEKGLNLLIARGNKVPLPDDKVDIYASGVLIGYQGYAGKTVLNKIGMFNGGKDPLTDVYYTYRTDDKLTRYQILGKTEGILSYDLIKSSYAFNSLNTQIKTIGNKLGIILNTGSLSPIQNDGNNIDILKTENEYIVYLNDNNIIEGTGGSLFNHLYHGSELMYLHKTLAKFDKDLYLYFDMRTITIDGKMKDYSFHGNNGICYEGDGKSTRVEYLCRKGGPLIGRGVKFDGIDDNIGFKYPEIDQYNWTIDITVEALNNEKIVFLSPRSNGHDQFLWIDPSRGRIGVQLAESADENNRSHYVQKEYSTSQIYNITYQRTEEYMYIYVDGELIDTFEDTDVSGVWDDEWIIGMRSTGQYALNGKILELKVFNKILTSKEIKQSYLNLLIN